jgi:hypothetical protein
MTAREHLLIEIDGLGDPELEYVATIAASLRTRPTEAPLPSFDPAVYGALYQEFADEDRALAELGLGDYEAGLKREDSA